MMAWLQSLSGGAATFVGALTGSILGLIALLLGALFNFHLNRRRDARLLIEEANAVAAALYGEVLLIQREIVKVGNRIASVEMQFPKGKFDQLFLDENPVSDSTLYNALASKLGMLPPAEVLTFTEFHALLKELRHWLPRMPEDEARRYGYSVLYVLEPIRNAITVIAPALRSIEKRLGIQEAAPEPDLNKIHDMIEMEELEFQAAQQQYATE